MRQNLRDHHSSESDVLICERGTHGRSLRYTQRFA
jgi:hypothetical protein